MSAVCMFHVGKKESPPQIIQIQGQSFLNSDCVLKDSSISHVEITAPLYLDLDLAPRGTGLGGMNDIRR